MKTNLCSSHQFLYKNLPRGYVLSFCRWYGISLLELRSIFEELKFPKMSVIMSFYISLATFRKASKAVLFQRGFGKG